MNIVGMIDTGGRKLDALDGGRPRIRRIGHRHRLHDDRRAAADLNAAHFDADRAMELHD